MAKPNQKCVRMSDEVLKIVENYKNGEGFNEKFENLVIEFYKTIPEREKYKKNLDRQIDEKLDKLKAIEKRMNELQNIEFVLKNITRDILKVQELAASVTVVSQNESCSQEPGIENEIQKRKGRKCVS